MAIIGPPTTVTVKAAYPMTMGFGVPMISPGATDPMLQGAAYRCVSLCVKGEAHRMSLCASVGSVFLHAAESTASPYGAEGKHTGCPYVLFLAAYGCFSAHCRV